MKMKRARVVVTLAVDVLVPEGSTVDPLEVGNSVERRVRVMRAHQSRQDQLFVQDEEGKQKLNEKYFEVDRVYVVDPQPTEVST